MTTSLIESVKTVFLYTTIFLFVITWIDPTETHIYNIESVLYRLFLTLNVVMAIVTNYFMQGQILPTLALLLNLGKVFIPSNMIPINEFMGLYLRINTMLLFGVFGLFMVTQVGMLSMFLPPMLVSKNKTVVTILWILKTMITMIPTLFKYEGMVKYGMLLVDLVKIAMCVVSIVLDFIKERKMISKKKKAKEEVIEKEKVFKTMDEMVSDDDDSDVDDFSLGQALEEDLEEDEEVYEDVDEPVVESDNLDLHAFLETLEATS